MVTAEQLREAAGYRSDGDAHLMACAAELIEKLQCFQDEAVEALKWSASWLDEYENVLSHYEGRSSYARSLIAEVEKSGGADG